MKNLIRCIFILSVLMPAINSYGQAWNTVGSGIPGNWYSSNEAHSYVYNNELYVAHRASTMKIAVHKWNGLNWVAFPSLSVNASLNDFVINNNGMYLITAGLSGSVSFYEFDGTSWQAKAPSGYSGQSKTAEDVNGELVIGGVFTAGGGISNIYKYDGTNFIALPTGPNDVRDIHQFQGTLYISDYKNAASTNPDGLLELNGSAWNQTAHYFKQSTNTTQNSFTIFDFQNELYVADDRPSNSEVIYHVQADSLDRIDSIGIDLRDYAVFNNSIYLGGEAGVGKPLSIVAFDGSTFSSITGAPKYALGLETLNNELYLISGETNSGWSGNVNFNHILSTQPNHSVLNGRTFLDANSDCFLNWGEINVANAIIKIGSNTVSSGASGQYSLSFISGTYQVDTVYIPTINAKNINLQCALPSSISIGSAQTISQDIAFDHSVPVDMQIKVTAFLGWRARYGFKEYYKVDIGNAGNTTAPLTNLTVQVPPGMSMITSSPAAASTSGNTFTYNFLNMQPLETRSILIGAKVDTSVNSIGDTLVWRSFLGPVVGDADLSDNADTLEVIVTGAFDPNDKQASANEISPSTKRIDYHIRFQNTGNDTAYKVTVVDTLDLTLPITNIVINSASHPYNLSVMNNILVWEFDNINLPDSGASYSGSQGYVRFSAGIDPNLGIGDTISNDAQIYFDYQVPVHTNHAKTAIVQGVGMEEYSNKPKTMEVFPNPATDVVFVKNVSGEIQHIKMVDATGKLIKELEVRPMNQESININVLKSGIYFITDGVQAYRLLIKD